MTAWERWQTSAIAVHLLSDEARAAGYTVVKVHPLCREAFLEWTQLMTTYAALATHRAPPQDVREAMSRWRTLTRRLSAALRRLRAGQPATIPAPFLEDHDAHAAFPLA